MFGNEVESYKCEPRLGISHDLPSECRNAELLELVSAWQWRAGSSHFQETFLMTVLQNWEITPAVEYPCPYPLLGAARTHGFTYLPTPRSTVVLEKLAGP
jgi:hypothetical protein